MTTPLDFTHETRPVRVSRLLLARARVTRGVVVDRLDLGVAHPCGGPTGVAESGGRDYVKTHLRS